MNVLPFQLYHPGPASLRGPTSSNDSFYPPEGLSIDFLTSTAAFPIFNDLTSFQITLFDTKALVPYVTARRGDVQ